MIRGPRAGRAIVLLVAVVLGGLACGTASVPPAASAPPESPVIVSVGPPTSTPGVADPPAATLVVEGGDPVVGQLGTYTWAGGGSASPWLPGAPMAVGAQETLTLAVQPRVAISDWKARIAPAVGDGAGAIVIATGTGSPVLGAPKAGSWTLAVTVGFGELGSATYAWRLDVT